MPAPTPRSLRVQSPGPTIASLGPRWFALAGLGLLQFWYFVVTPAPAFPLLVGIVAGAFAALAPYVYRADQARARRMLVVASIVLGLNIAMYVVRGPQVFSHRILLLAIPLGYVLFGIVRFAIAWGVQNQVRAFAMAGVAGALLLMVESGVERRHASPSAAVAAAAPVRAPRPASGATYPPQSTVRVAYPDNPALYFEVSGQSELGWKLAVNDPRSTADVRYPEDHPDMIHVDVTKAAGGVPWHVQLWRGGLPLRKGGQYHMVFRARAELPRTFAYSVSQGHPPWDLLSPYQQAPLTTDWQKFDLAFRATRSDDSARVNFDLGTDAVALDVADVQLTVGNPGIPVRPPSEPLFGITYHFNDLGCRGPDYPLERTRGTWRLLVLGDSYALGAGVRQEDTFAARLERTLNERSQVTGDSTRFEVIDCAVAGDGTAEERALYESVGKRYAPDVVLLSMVAGDDSARVDDVAPDRFLPAGKYARLFLGWTVVRRWIDRRHGRSLEDVGLVTRELTALRNEVRADNSRLVVMIFQDDDTEAWSRLSTGVEKSLAGTGTPYLNVAADLQQYRQTDLLAHPFLDAHPGPLAHRVVAAALARFLRQEQLLGSAAASPRSRGTAEDSARRPR